MRYFEFILPNERSKIIQAKNRTQAMEIFMKQTTCPAWFLEKHLRIVNLWRTPANEIVSKMKES